MHVVDLTALKADDPENHGKFASADVVRAIGARLASGQPLSDSTYNIGEAVGVIAVGATSAVGKVAATVVTTPFERPEAAAAQ